MSEKVRQTGSSGGSGRFRWQKMKNSETAEIETLLRQREFWCVGACSRFLRRSPPHDQVWVLRNAVGTVSALIVKNKRMLLPVFWGLKEIPLPSFIDGFFTSIPVHSIQGLWDEAIVLEHAMQKMGRQTVENIDYDLMSLDRSPNAACFASGPAGLALRKAEFTDLDGLAVLQGGYEREEVLPKGADFNAAASRLNMSQILGREQVMTAELGGRIVGKINTNAVSFTRFQVGGVFVHPDFRGLGIGLRMTAEFVRGLIAQGKGVTLFVKKSNPHARRMYERLGFSVLGDYRIVYY